MTEEIKNDTKSENNGKTTECGKNPDGTFAVGNKFGNGNKGARWFRTKVLKAINKIADGQSNPEDERIVEKLKEMALSGDIRAIELVIEIVDGKPTTPIEISGEINNPYSNLDDNAKLELARRNLEGDNPGKGEKGSDIPNGRNSELSPDGKNTQGSGGVFETTKPKENPVAPEKPLEDNGNNDSLHNTAITDKPGLESVPDK